MGDMNRRRRTLFALANRNPAGAPPEVPVVPVIDSCNPDNGDQAGGDLVAIYGSNLDIGETLLSITFGGSAATNIAIIDNETLECRTPAHAAGGVDVVATFSISGAITLAGGFTYN